MRGWFESTFGAGALVAQFVVALIVVIVLFGIITAFARRRNKNAGPAQARGRQPRLAVMDMADVDDRRKLLLIRRDNVEHLVMIGGPSDLVIESTIVRNRPAPQVSAPKAAERISERAPDHTAAGLATQAYSRAQVRMPSASPAGSEAASGDESRPQSGNGLQSDNGYGDARTAPPLRSPQFVNPYKPPELANDKKKPSPAAAPAEPALTPSPAFSPAAVAGLAAGAAALTAAAAKAKRHKLSPEPETPPERVAKAPPVLPAGFNGGGDLTTPSTDTAPDTATPEPAALEPVVNEEAAEAAKEPETAKATETATESVAPPVAVANAANEEPPAAEAKTGEDTGAATEGEQKAADETPVTEPVAAAEPAQAESAETADESPGESQPEDAAATDAADKAGFGDNLEAELAEALAPPQDQSGEVADTSAETAESVPEEPVDAGPDLASTTSDATGDATAETATEKPPATAVEMAPAKTFEEVMAEHAGGSDPDIVPSPQTDVPASPEPETVPAPLGNAGSDTAAKIAEPAAERPAAISPFPTIPEDIRRSVLEAARQAERSPDAGSGMADGGVKTTLGDLAERLEQALAEQASTLSGQLMSGADAKPAPGPAQSPDASIEEWERGELASSDAPAPDGMPEAAPSADANSDAASGESPRKSQAMLEDETDSGVIDFSDRKKSAPENKSSDSLEDEMARLLGELTGRNSAG